MLQFPAVADKTFLVTIGDRTVGGLCSRDPMVGPWQVPVADAAVTLMDYDGYRGEAMAIGERTPLALIDAPASCRMAVAEAVTNIAASGVARLTDLKLSANWMAPAGHPGEDAALYDGVRAVAMELCPALGIAIPVGKDSMSMRTTWRDGGRDMAVTAPVSLIVTAFAPVEDVRRALTPLLRRDCGDTDLLWIDLGAGKRRLGGSALAQVYGQLGDVAPDLDDPARLVAFFAAIEALSAEGRLLAYHDIGDGGLFATVCEMAFASRCGLDLALDADRRRIRSRLCSPRNPAPSCRSRRSERAGVIERLDGGGTRGPCDRRSRGARSDSHLARTARRCSTRRASISIGRGRRPRMRSSGCATIPRAPTRNTRGFWMRADPGLSPVLTFDPAEDIAAPYIATRCAAGDRDPARAGRQRPGRDGGGVRLAPASRRSTCT